MFFRKSNPPARGLQTLIGPAGKPAFNDHAFTAWAVENGLIDRVSKQMVACLADEFAELVDCQPRANSSSIDHWALRSEWIGAALPLGSSPFDGAAFTAWMARLGLTNVEVRSLRDHANWWCLVHQRCQPWEASDGVPTMLGPHGWVKRRGPQRVRGDRIDRATYYQLSLESMRAAA